MKEGITTSEFWLTLATILVVSAVLWADKISAEVWATVVGGLVAWWTVNRTALKVKNGNK